MKRYRFKNRIARAGYSRFVYRSGRSRTFNTASGRRRAFIRY